MKKLMLTCVACFTACFGVFAQQENLQIAWPGEYKWKVVSNQSNAAMNLVELIPGAETLNNWSIMATMVSYKNKRVANIAEVQPMLLANMKKTAPKARLAVLESGTKNGRQWTIFKIEAPAFTTVPRPESQLYYATQGDKTLYVSFVAQKTAWLPGAFATKWSNVFKGAQLVMK
ncbi:hypothetical protein [Mucilaginibacter pedocola]|uniref:PsbP C-terminal domain-containing protein n=1 Tax=Mucilaginibacter pedocola TaxID=1792845 RepID=A0A1S9PLH2_9SPHI|nr:hypothetical protein [Mucilaginibacter pedocola]OOQ61813.1 hypothetical protein BC343_01735 [Mucilaginibacter pedocola]